MPIDTASRSDPLRRRLRHLTPGERAEEAAAFVELFHRENGLPSATMKARRAEVLRSLRRENWYEHTADELAFGARVAWRNSARCIGRLFWKSLEVIDCRAVTDSDEMASRLFAQMRMAHAGDRVTPIISVFPPMKGDASPTYAENAQLIQYAGYLDPSGGVIGDPQNLEFTRIARSLGWQAPEPHGPFDVLPLMLRTPGGGRLIYSLPEDLIREVPIRHPSRAGLDGLGLRWYAVPFVSDMILSIGSIDYPCAPFNGFYQGTEIASRNLVDSARYDLLAAAASAMGIDRSERLWKDETLTELNRAVLHSFDQAGVSICDHHAASEWHLTFVRTEQAAARAVAGDWAWIVPPQASAACPVFHLPMSDQSDVPNFYRSRASDGADLAVRRSTEVEGRMRGRWRRWQRRWRWRWRKWIRERTR